MFNNLLMVGLGGALGSMARFGCQRLVSSSFPWGTLVVNLSGCLLIGILWGYFLRHSGDQAMRLLLMTGFCGGFTTFSAFSQESITMILSQRWLYFFTYVTLSLIGGLTATFLGFKLTS